MKGLLLDRDGVLNDPPASGYVTDPTEFRWLPGSLAACRRLVAARVPVAVVTNQSAVGRGLLTESRLARVHAVLRRDVGAEWPIFHCPHVPEHGCGCRKPQPMLLLRAANHLNLHKADVVLVGDHHTDQQAARAAAMPFHHVQTGRETELPAPATTFPDLAAVVETVLSEWAC